MSHPSEDGSRYIYKNLSIHLFCWRAALCICMASSVVTCSPPPPLQPPLKPLKPSSRMMRTEKVKLCSTSHPSQHIATETTRGSYIQQHLHMNRLTGMPLNARGRVVAGSAWTRSSRRRGPQGCMPPKDDGIKTLMWETPHLNALRFTLKDELKQFRGEPSIRCRLNLRPLHKSKGGFINGRTAAEDGQSASVTNWGDANKRLLRKVARLECFLLV